MPHRIISEIISALGFEPTAEQYNAMVAFGNFAMSREPRRLMILRGAAGTGKTSVASAIVKAMKRMGQKTMLLAPTGRAAKVFSVTSGQPAYTIHRCIYRQKKFDATGGKFSINYNKQANTLFLVDESSMIANDGMGLSPFGTGRLLDDLISFVYGGAKNCHLMLIGDSAQLPPVGETTSPALNAGFMAGYGVAVFEATMDEVLRQSLESGILHNATMIRRMLEHDAVTYMPHVELKGFADIKVISGADIVDAISGSYSEVGIDETMVITRSNKLATRYNMGIRNMVIEMDEQLCRGDMVMVVKNNYFWIKQEESEDGKEAGQSQLRQCMEFIANGDRAMVRRVRHVHDLYGFHFADVTLSFPDYEDQEVETTVVLDSLLADSPSLTQEQNEQLFNNVYADYAEYRIKEMRMKKVREDPHFNALQIKFAYAVTCHKAQGGQWAHIYIDQGYITRQMMNADYIHWLYTAFTRATERLYLVNWRNEPLT